VRAVAAYNRGMPRIREIEDPGDDPILKETWVREQQLFGAILNPTKVQAHTPGIMKAAKQLSVAVERSGLLPPQLLALVYLRVAVINGCPF
jgi:alkylhydroperoxidase family enzyme